MQEMDLMILGRKKFLEYLKHSLEEGAHVKPKEIIAFEAANAASNDLDDLVDYDEILSYRRGISIAMEDWVANPVLESQES
jgi:hypothetical protein